jgi:DNA-binding GntR family transcriptional regulator
MSIEATVLRAMLRLARRCESADEEALALRVGGSRAEVRGAMRRLDSAGLVERRPGRAPRLTLAGLAVAIGLLPAGAARTGPSSRRSSRAA